MVDFSSNYPKEVTVEVPMQADWGYALASVIGTSHDATKSPCQDACMCQVLRDIGGHPVLIAVVSDGAGSATHSQDGAMLACSLFVAEMENYFDTGGQVNEINQAFIAGWLKHFQNEIEIRADAIEVSARDFACTFLAAILGGTHAAFVQIGDGAIVVSGQEEPNQYDYVFWPQKGEYENMTYFATDPAILQTFDFDTAARTIDDVSLFSDGLQRLALDFGAGIPHQPFFRPMFAPLHEMQSSNPAFDAPHYNKLSTALEKYLSSPAINSRTDDDKTLVLATRRKLQNKDHAPLVPIALLPDDTSADTSDACI